jgi:hypothetical protein
MPSTDAARGKRNCAAQINYRANPRRKQLIIDDY